MYVWQFLAALGLGASEEQQHRLVMAVKYVFFIPSPSYPILSIHYIFDPIHPSTHPSIALRDFRRRDANIITQRPSHGNRDAKQNPST